MPPALTHDQDLPALLTDDVARRVDMPLSLALIVAAFTALAWAYSAELMFRVWTTFKTRRGLYFYSLQIAALGATLHALIFIFKLFFVVENAIIIATFLTIGWYGMVTGQALVLYSRLHILVLDRRRLRWVLYMIITNVCLFHFPTTVFTFGSNVHPENEVWTHGFSVYEKIQMTAFSTQEFIISALYIWETRKILKPRESFQKKRVRKVIKHLVYVQIVIIILDITMLACEYANLYTVEATIKPAIYAFKLHLEFPILNQLTQILATGEQVSMFHSGERSHSFNHSHRPDEMRMAAMRHGGGGGTNGSTTDPRAPNFYVTASKNRSGDAPVVDEHGQIVATTEVTVQHSEIDKHATDLFDHEPLHNGRNSSAPMHNPTLGRSLRGYRKRSLSSSEIELAKSGGSQNTDL